MDYTQILDELEDLIENDFQQNKVEEKAFELVNNLKSTWDILRLASMIRWAPYESEDDAIESSLNITDRAIEKAVNENNKSDLETIIDELEMSMELDERADEVKKIMYKMSEKN